MRNWKCGFVLVGMALMAAMEGCANKTSDVADQLLPGEVPVTVHVDPTRPGPAIGEEFSGVSFEMRMVLAGRDGSHFFDASDTELVGMFRGLGIKSLRVGGNSLDSAESSPTSADIDSLYAFAKAAHIRVIYSVKLKNVTDPSDAVRQIKYLWPRYADLTECVTLGNEPNIFFADTAPGGVGTAPATRTAILGGTGDSGAVGIGYVAYRKAWENIARALIQAAPDIRLCGPSSTPGKVAWAGAFAHDETSGEFAKNLVIITQHAYPGGNAQKVTDPGAGRELILSTKMQAGYEKFYSAFVPQVLAAQKAYRLEESNSLFHGGAANLSNSAASALWGLDFMWWWATHGAAGINFHTGMNTAPAARPPGGYDLFWNSPAGIQVHPMGYGVKTFDVAGRGAILPVEIVNTANMNLTAYAAKTTNARPKQIYVTVINRENLKGNGGGRDAAVTIDLGDGQWYQSTMYLRQDKDDLGATGNMTLGGATIAKDGSWDGKWSEAKITRGRLLVHVKAGEAAVVKVARQLD